MYRRGHVVTRRDTVAVTLDGLAGTTVFFSQRCVRDTVLDVLNVIAVLVCLSKIVIASGCRGDSI